MLRSALLGCAGLVLSQIPATGPAVAQDAGPLKPVTAGIGSLAIPNSSRPSTGSGGVPRPHTHSMRFVPTAAIHPDNGTGTFYETPASLACVYRQGPMPYGCIPGSVTTVASGGSRTIAVVDAYDHPNIASDLARYSSFFGLPAPTIQVVFAGGTRPAQDPTGGWEAEEAIDVEMAHALAPGARIVLVEAATPDDLFTAVDVASNLVAQAGGGEVSMSWGSGEFSSESAYDIHFQKAGVVYFASTGDDPGTEYPSVSPYVVAVGGTSIRRNPATGVLYGQSTWDQGGGGASSYIASPAYQGGVQAQTGAMRAVPDVAADANPYTGVLIYNSIPGDGLPAGWQVWGGTSVAAPVVAALTNASGTFQASSVAELTQLYANAGSNRFRPIQKGSCGPGDGYSAALPWSPCVGLGSPARPQPF